MKISLTYLKNHLVCFGAAVLLLVSIGAAKAQILLTIDVSNPNAVTITESTGTVVASAETSVNNGVDLLGFFTSNTGTFESSTVSGSTLTSGNLAGNPDDYYDSAVVDDYSPSDVDLTLYSSGGSDNQVFTAGTTTAFTGSLTVDLSALSTFLPTSGTGEIVAGYTGGHPGTTISNTPIGEWQVINSSVAAPEPSTWMLVLVGAAVIVAYRGLVRKFRARG
jgi:hypothetical protein